jgi:hypothetical protein
MTNVSRTNRNGLRPVSDLYSTPHDATRSFVAFERRRLRRAAGRARLIWEPAAGEGWIADVLEAEGFATFETDKYRHPRKSGRPCERRDVYDCRARLADVAVTNPPYSNGFSGDDFVRHVLSLKPKYAAFFLPITFFAGVSRRDILDRLFCGLRLARVLVPVWRLTLKPRLVKLKNSGVVTYGWFIWERARTWTAATWHRLYRVNLLQGVGA